MKFNQLSNNKDQTVNHMGALAFRMESEIELYSAVVTFMVDNSYYESGEERLKRIKKLIIECDPEFVCKLAVYARTYMNLRSVPILLTVELAKITNGNDLIRKTIASIVCRADEIKEVLAYYQIANKRKQTKKLNQLSKQIQKGLAEAFNSFDEYQFAKYNSKSEVSLRDALFLVHPKPKDENQQEIFNRIATNTLKIPYTWETEMSELGKKNFSSEIEKKNAVAKKWEELVESGSLGYMAILRNIRNILVKGSDRSLELAIQILTHRERILKSKQMPFRYLSAFIEIDKLSQEDQSFEKIKEKAEIVKNALEKALLIACENIPYQEGKTAILSDNSGSMYGDYAGKSLVSAMSSRKTADIANLFAVLYWEKCSDTYVGLFGDHLINAKLDREVNVFENFKIINEAAKECGPGTERGIFAYMEDIIKKKIIIDRMIIFSDCQIGEDCNWFDDRGNTGNNFNSLFKKYLKINPEVKVYTVDLKGYGNSLTKSSKNMVYISGWNERIFDMIYYIEQGSTIVDEIMKIKL